MDSYKKYLSMIGRAFAILMGVWGVVELLSHFDKDPFKDNFFTFVLFVLFFIVITKFFVYYIKINKNDIDDTIKKSKENFIGRTI
jgi:hypothetical protein